MPALPATLTIGAHRWRLRLHDEAAMQPHQEKYHEESGDPGLLLGSCRAPLLEIDLRTHVGDAVIPPSKLAETALHEALHAVFDQVGLDDHPDEEAIISALAPTLLSLLRANPDFVAFLLTTDEETPCS